MESMYYYIIDIAQKDHNILLSVSAMVQKDKYDNHSLKGILNRFKNKPEKNLVKKKFHQYCL